MSTNAVDFNQAQQQLTHALGAIPAQWLWVNVSQQSLDVYQGRELVASYPVSTAAKGVGNQANSLQTPLGVHQIAQKIGEGQPLGRVFKARQPTSRIADIIQQAKHINEDLVTTRILWLKGLEQGVNAGGNVDSFQRYIYIHGTAEEGLIGQPASHGCVRMKNADVVELFDDVDLSTIVLITQ